MEGHLNTLTGEVSVEPQVGLRRGFLTKIAVLIAVTLGSMVLAGWLWGIRPLTSLIPNYATMKPNTAFCFVAAGLALWLLRHPSTRVKSAHPFHPPWGQICAFLVALVGLLTLGEYCLKLNFGIDEMLLRDPWTDLRVSPAGRMSIATAFGFFMLGSSLFFLGRKSSQDAIASQILALSGLVAATFASLAYVYGDHGPYVVSFYTTIAVHTAIVLAVLCVGTLLARPDQGMMSVLTSDYAGGRLARLILPWALILPFSVGWLKLLGENAGLYGNEFGLALFATSNLIIFSTLVWTNAKSLNIRAAELRQGAHGYGFLADVMPQIVWTAKPDGNIDYCNQRWIDYCGMNLEQTQGQGWQLVVHPDDLRSCVDHWTKAISTGREYETEYRFKRASDGAYRWHLGRAFPLRDQTGKIVQWVGTSTDINDQKRARYDLEERVAGRSAELAEAKEKLQGVLDAATHASIIATDTEGLITVFNRGSEQMLGYSSDEMVGHQTPMVFHLESEIAARGRELTEELGKPVQGFEVLVEKARNGHHDEGEWTFVRKDGQRLTVNLVATASHDADGKITGFLGVAMDVTARKQAERELKKSRESLDVILSTSLDGMIFYEAIRDDAGVLRDFRFALVNAAAEKLSGQNASQLLGHTVLEKFALVAENGLFDKFVRIVEENLALEFEYHSRRTDPPHWYRIAGVKLGDGLALSYSDITERKEAEDKLRLWRTGSV